MSNKFSTESSGKYNEKSTYVDIDVDLKKHPVTNDAVIVKDDYAIKQSVENIVMFEYNEAPFHPERGTDLKRVLFEPIDIATTMYIKDAITNSLKAYEPRIDLLEVVVVPDEDNQRYGIDIVFVIKGREYDSTISFVLSRLI